MTAHEVKKIVPPLDGSARFSHAGFNFLNYAAACLSRSRPDQGVARRPQPVGGDGPLAKDDELPFDLSHPDEGRRGPSGGWRAGIEHKVDPGGQGRVQVPTAPNSSLP